jgi:RimJ/RimL family protein N-acetyltransferase
MKLSFVDVYSEGQPQLAFLETLYRQLKERPAEANISHKGMPTWREHLQFVDSKPYASWYLLYADKELVGQIYVTRQNEIGIFIEKGHRSNGYGRAAIEKMIEAHKGHKPFLANVAPGNYASQRLFESMGFKLVQHTYRLEKSDG